MAPGAATEEYRNPGTPDGRDGSKLHREVTKHGHTRPNVERESAERRAAEWVQQGTRSDVVSS
jgi:hypothetical protein